MPKRKPRDWTKWIKDVEDDFKQFSIGVGDGIAQVMGVGVRNIREKQILEGKQKIRTGKRGRFSTFLPAPGANKEDKRGKKVFHKSKLMSRGRNVRRYFNQPRFKLTKPNLIQKVDGVYDVARATMGQGKWPVRIHRERGEYMGEMIISGRVAQAFAVWQFGRRRRGKVSVNDQTPKQSRGSKRPIVLRGLRTGARQMNNLLKRKTAQALKRTGDT